VTVCIATLFRWNYGTLASPEFGMAAITASDRKITAGDVEYEPPKLKMAQLSPRCLVLIAGDYAIASEAIFGTHKQLRGDPNAAPENIALVYGRAIQAIKRRQAEDLILSPLGLNTDTFMAQQRDLSNVFVDRITNQLQSYRGEDVEALVVGSDGADVQIWAVDTKGITSCLNDLGFGAIGIGAWHAKSRFMQTGYANTAIFAPALAVTFAAKKAAEVAPGVGTATDIRIVTRDRINPLANELEEKLPPIFENYRTGRAQLELEAVAALQSYIDGLSQTPPPAPPTSAGAVPENQQSENP
jgi:hypothetical protein